ncbi:hypothetical protein IscW_ISCW020848 [Ixodes scapularis]|uniref:Uncharacterized protein n=1 Tax=Ixodes scapularis TaxID=6945 RepID=B7PX89_IXOSC|nr:hypothetical protein IscW_ISCW020848 [Ixodes scapularis]|eukprot:XP_002399645.1 hypothetical protein IscW_ISCW020848 [Ixodes scapularis]
MQCPHDGLQRARWTVSGLKHRLATWKPVERLSCWYNQFWGTDVEEDRLHIIDGDEGFVNWFCLPFLRRPKRWPQAEVAPDLNRHHAPAFFDNNAIEEDE